MLTILMGASHTPSGVLIKGEKRILNPGQWLVSREKLKALSGASDQNIRTAITTMELTGFLTKEVTNDKKTILTINKWELYQGCGEVTNDLTDSQPTSNQRVTNDQPDYKKVKKGKNLKTNPSLPVPQNETDVDRMAIAVYDHYKKFVKSGSREITLKHVRRILMNEGRTQAALIAAIDAYTQTDRFRGVSDKQYYIEPSNFFGQARRFTDFCPTDNDVVPVEDKKAEQRRWAQERARQTQAEMDAASEDFGEHLKKITEKLKGG